MHSRTRYEAFQQDDAVVGIRAIDKTGIIIREIRDLSDNYDQAINLALLYTENHLMPENFQAITEELVGVLI